MTMKQLPGPKDHPDILLGRVMASQARVEETVRTMANSITGIVTRLDRIETRLDHHPPYSEEDADAITGVESIEQATDAARRQRARAALAELEKKEQETKARKSKVTAIVATIIAVIAGVMQGLQLANVIK